MGIKRGVEKPTNENRMDWLCSNGKQVSNGVFSGVSRFKVNRAAPNLEELNNMLASFEEKSRNSFEKMYQRVLENESLLAHNEINSSDLDESQVGGCGSDMLECGCDYSCKNGEDLDDCFRYMYAVICILDGSGSFNGLSFGQLIGTSLELLKSFNVEQCAADVAERRGVCIEELVKWEKIEISDYIPETPNEPALCHIAVQTSVHKPKGCDFECQVGQELCELSSIAERMILLDNNLNIRTEELRVMKAEMLGHVEKIGSLERNLSEAIKQGVILQDSLMNLQAIKADMDNEIISKSREILKLGDELKNVKILNSTLNMECNGEQYKRMIMIISLIKIGESVGISPQEDLLKMFKCENFSCVNMESLNKRPCQVFADEINQRCMHLYKGGSAHPLPACWSGPGRSGIEPLVMRGLSALSFPMNSNCIGDDANQLRLRLQVLESESSLRFQELQSLNVEMETILQDNGRLKKIIQTLVGTVKIMSTNEGGVEISYDHISLQMKNAALEIDGCKQHENKRKKIDASVNPSEHFGVDVTPSFAFDGIVESGVCDLSSEGVWGF